MGFVGSHLCRALQNCGWDLRLLSRESTTWGKALEGVDVVVHLAARVHLKQEFGSEADAIYQRDNADLTDRLAAVAASSGVRRFIFISSIKAMGESTSVDTPLTESAPCNPLSPYGKSKKCAEAALLARRSESFEPVILRAPLLYGAGVKANFSLLCAAVASGVPLPVGGIRNSRSLLYVGNLVDVIMKCLEHPAVAGEVFLVSDGEDVSTPWLVRRIAGAMGRPCRVFTVPERVLLSIGKMCSRGDDVARIIDSFRIDSAKIRQTVGWVPKFSLDAGLAYLGQGYGHL